jgi:hypothetical protein
MTTEITTAGLATLIDAHLAAYADPDTSRRTATVQRIWADGGRLVDPPLAASGHAGIVDQAGLLLGQFPGHRFLRSSGIDHHHGVARYGWQLVGPDGSVVLEGLDIAQVDASGRLQQVTGFFGPLPAREPAAAAA